MQDPLPLSENDEKYMNYLLFLYDSATSDAERDEVVYKARRGFIEPACSFVVRVLKDPTSQNSIVHM